MLASVLALVSSTLTLVPEPRGAAASAPGAAAIGRAAASSDAPVSAPAPAVQLEQQAQGADFSNPPPSASLLEQLNAPVDAKTDDPLAKVTQPPSALSVVPKTTVSDAQRSAKDGKAATDTKKPSSFDPKTSTVLPDSVTPTQRVFMNPDGTMTRETSPTPVRFKSPDGAWRDYDLRLRDGKDGFEATASDQQVLIPKDPASGVAQVTTKAGAVRLQLPELSKDLAAPTAKDTTATYASKSKGASVNVSLRRYGFEQDVVLPDGTATPGYTTEFTVPAGVTARDGGSGVEFVDASGTVVGTFGGGRAADSKIDERSGHGAETSVITKLVDQSAGVAHVAVSIDPAWFTDPARQFPVTIDPLWYGAMPTGGIDLFTQSNLSSSQLGAADLRVGSYDGGYTVANSLLWFDFGILPGPQTFVTESHLSMYNQFSWQCDTRTPIDVVGVGQGYYPPAVVWSNQPGSDGKGIRSRSYFAKGGWSGGCNPGWVDLDTTSLARDWWLGNQPNYGVWLITDNTTGVNSYRSFTSGEAGYGTAPALFVTYELTPNSPALNTPLNDQTVVTTTPTMSWQASTDPDGYTPVHYWVRIATGADANSGAIVADSGEIAGTSWTVPADRLRDGETYYWGVWAADQYGYTRPTVNINRIKTNLRLGAGQPSPYDSEGPATVNLATGNLVASHASPQFPTVGGSIGVAYTYDSLRPAATGLTGTYFAGTTSLAAVADPRRRTDASVDFDWGTGSPSPGIWPDTYSARWTGFIRVPTSGTWAFGGQSDDGMRVWVNNTLVTDWWTDGGHYGLGSTINLTAGQPYSIKVEYYEVSGPSLIHLWASGPSWTAATIPSSWFSTDASPLPKGWAMTPTGGISYTSISIGWGFAVLTAANGSTVTYTYQNGGMIPPPGADGILASDGGNPATWSLTDPDGQVYTFDPSTGLLSSVRRVADDAHPASMTFTWSGTPARMTSITDPVSGRRLDLTYEGTGTCPSAPSGFDSAPPPRMLCKVAYWDGTETDVFYIGGNLARFVDPGGLTTDLTYNAAGTLETIRDPLQSDAVNAPAAARPNDDTTRTHVTYTAGLVSSVKLAEPTVGTARPEHTYAYSVGGNSEGITDVHVAGNSEPNGFSSRVAYDALKRATSSVDAVVTSRVTTTQWDPAKDLKIAVTDAAGLETTTIYDYADRPTDTYGPAPSSWFGSDRLPVSAHVNDVPRATTAYDEGMRGLHATYWNNTQLSGQPVAHGLGLGDASGAINVNWGTGAPPGVNADSFSIRLTGDIVLPQFGGWTLRAYSDDGVRVFVDDRLVTNSWTDHGYVASDSSPIWALDPAAHHRIRIEYYEHAGGAALGLFWLPPGSSTEQLVPGADLYPRYGVTTSSADPDGKRTTTSYVDASAGMVGATTVDPSGLALTTSSSYEPADATHYRRQSARTLPAGNATTFKYYGADTSATRNDPCSSTANVNQGGAAWEQVSPAPATGDPIVKESVYDTAGRVTASRIGNDQWSCVSYDSRGRPTTGSIPAADGEPARTITHNYAVGGNPLVTSVQDSAGTIQTTSDLLGRSISTTDVWNKTTTTSYDQAGRVVDTTGPQGPVHNDYDQAGRITGVKLDGQTVAVPSYDSAGRLDSATYPSGTGNGGNGTSLAPIGSDQLGRTTNITWKDPTNATITSDSVTRSLAGRVATESIDGGANATYTYDGAARLTAATIPGHTYAYGFGTVTGCPTGSAGGAGTNGNRTSVTDNSTTQSSCYDNADRLVSTQTPGYGTVAYDPHGNTTILGTESLAYDGADRHVSSTNGTTNVRYTRDATDAIVGRTVATVTPTSVAFRAKTDAVTTGSSTLTLTKPAGVQTNDVLIAEVAAVDIVTAPAGWTQIATKTMGYLVSSTYWHVATPGDPSSWAFSLVSNSTTAVGGIAAYSGVDPAAPVDVFATDSGTSSTVIVAPSVTTTNANDRLLTVYAVAANTTVVPPAGATERIDRGGGSGQSSATLEASDRQLNSAGAIGTQTATAAASGMWAAQAIALRPAPGTVTTTTSTLHYSAGAVLDASNNIIERSISLPGGAAITKRASGDVWSYPNVHGDVSATANTAGMKQGNTYTYDPYGTALTGIPDNAAGNMDTAWTGQRPLEHEANQLPIVEMGARPYSAVLGRFLGLDPVLGGTSNDYAYPADPINGADLDGRCEWCGLLPPGFWAFVASFNAGCHCDMLDPVYPPTQQQYIRGAASVYVAHERNLNPSAALDRKTIEINLRECGQFTRCKPFDWATFLGTMGLMLTTAGPWIARGNPVVGSVVIVFGFAASATAIAIDKGPCKGQRLVYLSITTMLSAAAIPGVGGPVYSNIMTGVTSGAQPSGCTP